jgi:hypothetical protein
VPATPRAVKVAEEAEVEAEVAAENGQERVDHAIGRVEDGPDADEEGELETEAFHGTATIAPTVRRVNPFRAAGG